MTGGVRLKNSLNNANLEFYTHTMIFRIGLLVLIFCNSAWSGEQKEVRSVSVSGGIVEPSFSTASTQNPAGMRGSPGFQLNGQGGVDSSFGNPLYRAGVLYGESHFGVAAGISDSPTDSGRSTAAFVGLAVGISPLMTTLGVAVYSGLSASGGSSANLGVILTPGDKFHLGFTGFGLGSGSSEWGAGLSYEVLPTFKLVLDTSADSRFKDFNAQPGLWLGTEKAGLTLSYGTAPGSRQLDNGFSAGGSLVLGEKVTWEAYFNHLARIYTSISLRI